MEYITSKIKNIYSNEIFEQQVFLNIDEMILFIENNINIVYTVFSSPHQNKFAKKNL